MFSVKRIAICGCEVTILAIAIVTVWLLMFIPTIVYFAKVSIAKFSDCEDWLL